MGNYDYTDASLEEFFEASQSNTVLAIPARAVQEIATAKRMQNQADQVTKTLKKYLINARQAQTNAKIVESLIS